MAIYQKYYEHFYFPIFEKVIKGRDTSKRYFESKQTQWNSHEEIVSNQAKSFRDLLRHAYQNCRYYHKAFEDLGIDINDKDPIDTLSECPVLTKELIRENFDHLVSDTHKDNIWKKSTGGSTGQPLHFGYTKESYEWRVAMSKRGYVWAGALPGAKQAYIWGVQLGEIGRIKLIKERLHQFIDRQVYFNCFDFDEKAMAQCLTDLNHFKPVVVVGYTNPLYNLALYVGDNSRIKFVPKGIISAAEKVHPYQRKVIEKVFGAKVFNTYGSREFMLIASECEKHEGMHVSADNLIVEIIKDDGTPAMEGETGKILVTDLHNYGMPFIRYEIGDLGIATTKSCSCGRGLPLIADVVGRSLDVIRTPEGKIVPGEFFPHLMKDFPDIVRFQVIQEKLDYLVIKIVPSTGLGNRSKEQICEAVQKQVGPTIVIDCEVVSDIPLTATGKYRVTISKVTGDQHG